MCADAADEAFRAPNLSGPIDVDACLRACPSSAETLGTYFQFAVAAVEKELGQIPETLFAGLERRRWVAWQRYPLAAFMRLAVNAAQIATPNLPLGEGLRRIGWMAYPSFASTMAGRVVLFAAGEDMDALFTVLPRAYDVSLTRGTARATRVGERHWCIELRDLHNFAGTYHLGVMEGALRARGVSGTVLVRSRPRPTDVDFDVRW